MPRPEKVQAVEEIKERMEDARAFFLTEYRGLSVKEQQTLRRALREAGAEYKVVKMSLAAIAARELGHDEIADELVGPTAIAFANEDAVAAAKALDDFAEANETFVLKIGLLSGNVLPPEQVSALAKLPSRDELLGKIAGAMAAPLYGAAGLFAAFTRNTASMLSQLLEKKEAGDPIAGESGGGAGAADTAVAESVEEADAADTAVAESVEEADASSDEPADAADEAGDEPVEEADAAPTESEPTDEPTPEADEPEADEPKASADDTDDAPDEADAESDEEE
ncbi:MAG: 50S ribosomal protein L10 [Acidimicrobiia bacterium]